MKIAVCFRGITRSLTHTIASIRNNVLAPARALGSVQIFSHLFEQEIIDNPRSGEKGRLDQVEYRLLESDWLLREKPGDCLEIYDFQKLQTFGDPWRDDFISLRNLIHELHSLKQSWLAAQQWRADLYLFMRPDLFYPASFRGLLEDTLNRQQRGLVVPLWQSSGGCNDRFAIATTAQAASSYAARVDNMIDYCIQNQRMLHGEEYLLHCLSRDRISIFLTDLKATRVRIGGVYVQEDYRLLRASNAAAFRYFLKTQYKNFSIKSALIDFSQKLKNKLGEFFNQR